MSSRRRLALTLPFLVGVVILGACSNDDGNRPPVSGGGLSEPGIGGSTEGGALTDSSFLLDGADGADGAICTQLTLMGVVVDGNFVAGDAPADTGGTPTNGTYTLTDYQTFVGDSSTSVGPTGISKKATIRITGGVIFEQIVGTTTQTSTELDTTLYGSFSAVSPTLTLNATCGSSALYGYTATDSTLRLTDPNTKEQFTYTIM